MSQEPREYFRIYKFTANSDGEFEFKTDIMGSYHPAELREYLKDIYTFIDSNFVHYQDVNSLSEAEFEFDLPLFSNEQIKHLWEGDEKYLYMVRDKLKKMIYQHICYRIEKDYFQVPLFNYLSSKDK